VFRKLASGAPLGAFLYHLSLQPASLDGLTPLNIPIRCASNEATKASFGVKYETDYEINISSNEDIWHWDLIKCAKENEPCHPLMDIEWRIYSSGVNIASGSGVRDLSAKDEKGIVIGKFRSSRGRNYEMQVRVGDRFTQLRPAAPRIKINVAQPSISVGLQFGPLIYTFFAYSFAAVAPMFLGLSAILIWKNRKRPAVQLPLNLS